MRRRLSHDDGGWVLITAIILMTVMLVTGAATASIVDTQTKESRVQRSRESAFNLAEAALYGEMYDLSHDWPGSGTSATPYPKCTQASSSSRCPDSSQIVGALPTGDGAGATWSTEVHDDGNSQFYSTASPSPYAYDQDGNHRLWVKATATAGGKTRSLVALVRVQIQPIDMPHASLLSGRVDFSNNGNKDFIDSTQGGSGVLVRCTITPNEASSCLGYAAGKNDTPATIGAKFQDHATGSPYQTGYPDTPAMSVASRLSLKARAIADGTYYASTCPSTLTGAVVYVASASCTFKSNSQFNSTTSPGILVMESGTLSFGGTSDFYGVIYAANLNNIAGTVVETQGNAVIHGAVLIDGHDSVMEIGSSKKNIVFDDSVFAPIGGYGTAGLIQNSWREL